MTEPHFSPAEVAQMIGVSESSVRRWVDGGLIHVFRTAGGHRRIFRSEAIRFVREREMRVVEPALLGLPTLATPGEEGPLTAGRLLALLRSPEPERARSAIVGAYVLGMDLASLLDGPVREALSELGMEWDAEEGGIYREHAALSLCVEALHQLRTLLPRPTPEAPLALGGAPAGDPYLLPSMMTATVLAEQGVRTLNLGPNTPASAFAYADANHRPSLLWLSVSVPPVEAEQRSLSEVFEQAMARGASVVVGGQAARTLLPLLLEAATVLDSMTGLAEFTETALPSLAP